MPKEINTEDYRTAQGHIDWARIKEARIANGEICPHCGAMKVTLFNSELGSPSPCYECKQFESPEEVEHSEMVRCPHCRHVWRPDDEIQSEGEGRAWLHCPQCSEEVEIRIKVQVSLVSVAIEPSTTPAF